MAAFEHVYGVPQRQGDLAAGEAFPGFFADDYESTIYVSKEHIALGDALLFDPNTAHQFINTGDAPLQFLCVIPKREA